MRAYKNGKIFSLFPSRNYPGRFKGYDLSLKF